MMGRNPFGWHFPPGAAGDPNAPWNQRDSDDETCEDCNGAGYVYDGKIDENVECKYCKGKGYIEQDSGDE